MHVSRNKKVINFHGDEKTMKTKYITYIVILCGFFTVLALPLVPETCSAQLWQSLPPYNVLWPLWSPVLSPPDPLTGLPKPLVSEITKSTFLPVQPALVWDPRLPFFHLLYNYVPVGGGLNELIYFDPSQGIVNPAYSFRVWPPSSYLQLATTAITPAPIPLPANYASLISFDPAQWLNIMVPVVNQAYQSLYGIYPNLLTAGELVPANYVFTGSFSAPLATPIVAPAVTPVVAPAVTPVVPAAPTVVAAPAVTPVAPAVVPFVPVVLPLPPIVQALI